MAGIGATLREARERQHLDIVDFEARTKIRAKYLRALEDEEWGLLPGYTFAKGFLRTYADMLGLDGRALVDEFKRQYRDPSELEAPPLSPAGRRSRPPRARERSREAGADRGGRVRQPGGPGRPPIVIVIAVLVVLLIGALYAVGVLLPRKSGAPTTPLAGTTATTTAHSHGRSRRGKASTPKVVGLALVPTGAVYVCLVGYPSASNDRRHVRLNGVTLTPGAHEPVRHDNHFHVTFGNNSVVMYINGHRRRVPPTAVPVSYNITLHGRVLRLPASEVPHCT